jgi:hypothetical protein
MDGMAGMTELKRCETSWAAWYGQCAVWLNEDTLCDQPRGHYPKTRHRGHDPNGSGRWVEYIERDGQAVEVDRGGGGW